MRTSSISIKATNMPLSEMASGVSVFCKNFCKRDFASWEMSLISGQRAIDAHSRVVASGEARCACRATY